MITDKKMQQIIITARQNGKSTAATADAFISELDKIIGPLNETQKKLLWCWYYRTHSL